jgi:hypothetical protein
MHALGVRARKRLYIQMEYKERMTLGDLCILHVVQNPCAREKTNGADKIP